MKRNIIVRTQFAGVHLWADAPDVVGYLRSQHRHVFNIEAKISVDHNDRELEFIMVKAEIDKFMQEYIEAKKQQVTRPEELNLGSCEMMCEYLIEKLTEKYGNRDYTVRVFEDNENGGEVIVERGIE